eukprot:352891_1
MTSFSTYSGWADETLFDSEVIWLGREDIAGIMSGEIGFPAFGAAFLSSRIGEFRSPMTSFSTYSGWADETLFDSEVIWFGRDEIAEIMSGEIGFPAFGAAFLSSRNGEFRGPLVLNLSAFE